MDDDPASPNYRDLYVPEFQGKLKKFSPNGELLSSLETPEFGTSGVAVNPATGDVYVTSYPFNAVLVYNPQGELFKFFSIEAHSPEPEGIAVSPAGDVYVVNGGGPAARKGTTEVYDEAGNWLKTLDENPSYGVAVDPVDEHVFVDEGGSGVGVRTLRCARRQPDRGRPPLPLGLTRCRSGHPCNRQPRPD